MAKKDLDVASQQYGWQTTSDVSRAMIGAGTAGQSRIKAGLRAAWEAKTGSMYSGSDTTKVARVLRLLGKQNAAKWYDRFFAAQKQAEKGQKRGPQERREPTISTGGGGKVVSMLKAQDTRLTAIHAMLDVVSQDVSDIKKVISPKGVVAVGRKGSGKDGQVQFVQFNPLAPQGEQYRQITKSGKLTNLKPGKAFQQSATAGAVLATAKLALKIQAEETKRSELRKKYGFKEKEEKYKQKEPLSIIVDRLDRIENKIGEKDKKGGGLFKMLAALITSTLGSLLSGTLGTVLLGAAVAMLGVAIGTYLNNKFGLSQKINDAIDTAKGWFGNSEKDKMNKSLLASVAARNEIITEKNNELAKLGWQKEYDETFDQGDGVLAVRSGKFWRTDTGQRYEGKDVPQEVKDAFKIDPRDPRIPTGSLKDKPSGVQNKDIPPEGRAFLDALAGPESGGRYDRIVGDGKYGGRATFDDFSKHPEEAGVGLKKNGKWTHINDPEMADWSTAAGKYQFTASQWEEEKRKHGYTDFSPETQDLAAWNLAKERYTKNTGGDLEEALKSKDFKSITQGLKGTWTSLEGGKEASPQGSAEATQQRFEKFLQNQSTPAKTIPGALVDNQSRQKDAATSVPASMALLAPTVVNNNVSPITSVPRNLPKADTMTADNSLLRASLRDQQHPTLV
jgi:muramidase (phage lysozyme)